MALRDFLERVEENRPELVLYTAADDPDVAELFSTRAVSLRTRSLPSVSSDGFLVIRADGEFVSSIGFRELREFLEPPIYRPWDDGLIGAGYCTLLEVLDDTLWYTLDRRQLLATSREIENRAWRVGTGTLVAGFQRPGALESQVPVYDRLSRETDLGVTVHCRADRAPSAIPDATVRVHASEEIGTHWLLAYDGGSDDLQSCALLAREREPGAYAGFWTYDPGFVAEILEYVRERYG
ncbi:DICT sensory domain-containing protein [Natrononativus amylolyticus]|uniref:DICT sensory domain-containing protein n=1 Tax=Natrononativus amylolyticus TaxID=2963434 RepID=UPI0020CF00D6|nr:DICT sensory domain-containing protein [Natrononativus amylolyticus]